MIERKLNPDNKQLDVNYSGTIVLQDVIENIHRVFNDYDLPKNMFILEDARQANYNVSIKDNERILETLGKYVDNFNLLKVAMVQDKPVETAINLDYEYHARFPNFHYKVFTTIESAKIWLYANL